MTAIIVRADITDPTYIRLPSDTIKDAYLAKGLARFSQLCTAYGIVEASIPASAPYTPKEVASVCTLIEMCTDLVGSDFREVQNGFSIDVYKAKLDVLQAKLQELLAKFTPENCGYTDTDDSTGTSTVGFSYGRG